MIFLFRYTLIAFIAVFSFVPHALAQESNSQKKINTNEGLVDWELHRSVTNTFDVKFPQKYKYNIFPFMFNEETVAFSGQILSSLDGTPANKDKSILIKSVQTFGEPLTQRQVKRILKREADKYESSASAIGGKVSSNEDFDEKGVFGKNIYITYTDKGEKYGIRIRLYITNYTKIEQVLTGPAKTMYSYRAEDFFNSLVPAKGITKYEGDKPLGTGWVKYPSKNNVFTVTLPPKNSDYTPFLPEFPASKTKDAVKFEIVDPVIEESVYYNVYSYKTGKPLNYGDVKSILFSNHVSRFVGNASIDNLETENSKDGDVNVMRTRLVITPIKRYPHVNVIVLEARYSKDTAIIKEYLSNATHSLSDLHNTLFSLTEFHPSKYSPSSNSE